MRVTRRRGRINVDLRGLPAAPVELNGREDRWMEGRRLEAERHLAEVRERPSRSIPARMKTAVDRWSEQAGWVAAGLEGATVTRAPSPQGDGGRRGPGPSDPTGAQLQRTLDAIAEEVWEFAHLTGPCSLDGMPVNQDRVVDERWGKEHRCATGSALDVADLVGLDVDPDEVVDGLLGTPSSSTKAFHEAVGAAAAWHNVTASQVQGRFDQAWRDGVEPSILEDWTSRTQELARRMDALAGRLAEWSGRKERTCRAEGCGAAVPAPETTARGGAMCDACRQRRSRHLRAVS